MQPLRLFAPCLLLMVALATGCTHTYEVPKGPLPLSRTSPHQPLAVVLSISSDLRSAGWEREYMGDKWVIPLGDALVTNCEQVARAAFERVEVTDRPAPNRPRLEPKVVSIERTVGATAFGDSFLDIVLEWRLEKPDGSTIWVETVNGRGQANTGNVFTEHSNARKQIHQALTELFQASYEALVGAKEIRNWGAAQGATPTVRAMPPAGDAGRSE